MTQVELISAGIATGFGLSSMVEILGYIIAYLYNLLIL